MRSAFAKELSPIPFVVAAVCTAIDFKCCTSVVAPVKNTASDSSSSRVSSVFNADLALPPQLSKPPQRTKRTSNPIARRSPQKSQQRQQTHKSCDKYSGPFRSRKY